MMINGIDPVEFIPNGRLTSFKHPDFNASEQYFIDDVLQPADPEKTDNIEHTFRIHDDFWIFKDDKNYQIEELFCCKNLAIASRGNKISNNLHTSYTCETDIKHAVWCKFKVEKEGKASKTHSKKCRQIEIDCICLVDSYFLKVFTERGENYVSSLNFKVSAIWAIKFGILLEKSVSSAHNYRTSNECKNVSAEKTNAMIYSLTHPLDEMSPVILKHGNTTYPWVQNLQIIFTCSDPSFVFVFDLKTGLHSVYKIRKCSAEESQANNYNSHNNTFSSNNSIFSASMQITANNTSGVKFTNNKVYFNNLVPLLSPFRSKMTSQTTCCANISLSSQHLSRSHSPMATISRCQSPTNPVIPTMSTTSSGHLTNQNRSHSTLAHSMYQTHCSTYFYKSQNHYSGHQSATTVKAELCLEHVWTESSNLIKETVDDIVCASTVFITTDLIGQIYLCYLIKKQHRLSLIRLEKSNNSDQFIIGVITSIVAKSAVNLSNLNMMAVMELNGNIAIYSGASFVGKLHIPSIIPNLTGSNCVIPNFHGKDLSPYPRRSSLLSPGKSSTPDVKFDDGMHLLSPVGIIHTDSNITIHSLFDNSFINLTKAISNKIILEYGSSYYVKISLPSMKASPIVRMCLQTLKCILPRDLSVQLLTKWYVARNAPGPQDLTVEQEWTLFLVIFFTLFGYEANRLNITPYDDSEHISEGCSPVVSSKKQKTINHGSVEDWSYLMTSEMTNHVLFFFRDNFGFTKFNQNNHDDITKMEPKTIENNKINVQSAFITYLPYVLFSLHLLYEELKLRCNMCENLYLLAKLLHQLSMDLNLSNYKQYYASDFPNLSNRKTDFQINNTDIHKIFVPNFVTSDIPNIQKTLHNLLQFASNFTYPYLLQTNTISKNLTQFFSIFTRKKNDNILEFDHFFKLTSQSTNKTPLDIKKSDNEILEKIIMLSYESGINKQEIDNLPLGIKYVLYSVINQSRENPPSNWPSLVYNLIDRQDLAALGNNCREYSSTNYSEHKHQHLNNINNLEHNDGMDFDYTILRLRFNADHRVREVRKLLDSSKPVKICITQRPDVSDHEFIEEQEKYLLALSTRTMALPVGRGMFTLKTSKPVNTEQLPIPRLCLTGKAPPRGTTVELTHIEVPANMNLWPLFHNGVATGLCIHPNASNVDSTWIVYNKQQQGELGIEHSGFLMALGLNGHLKNLAPFSMYEYLVECHEATSVGLLLGLSATHRSSMNVSMTKLLSLHVETLLPPTSIELNVQQNVQVAALMGVGLVYQGTNHRHIAHALLSEIGRPPGPEMRNCVDRESYSLAAGLALGLVVLNSGGASDLANIPDTLHYYMVGGNARPFCGSQKDKYKSPSYQIREGDAINVDVTSPGATIALGLMYIKSGNHAIAEWMTAPNTQYLLDFVRPDLLLLRILARSLILWDDIKPTKTWVSSHVPDIIAKYKLQKPTTIMTEPVDLETINQAYCNIIAGACMSLGLKYAGTENIMAFKTLYHFLKMFMTLAHKSVAELAGKATIETCLNIVLLSASIVMAGTGNLEVLRVCRYIRTRVGPTNSVVTYGSHVATHMALGFLFLGGGSYTLSNDPPSIAALIISLFPKFPTHSNDNRYHLQALRHFYVLATEPRLLLPKDIDNGKFCYAKIRIIFKSDSKKGQKIVLKAPCLLPQLDILDRIEINDDRYWKIIFDKERNFKQLKRILDDSCVLYVKQRAGCLSHMEDPQGFRTLLARTLTTENVIVWTASLKQITSFTTDRTNVNFVNRFLKSNFHNNIKCENFFSGRKQAESICFSNSKNYYTNKFDTPNQIHEVFQEISLDENSYLQILIRMAYECVIRDKMNFLPLWINIHKIHPTTCKQPKLNSIWQMKLLYLFGLYKVYFQDFKHLLSTENILAKKQQICFIMDTYENDLSSFSKNFESVCGNNWIDFFEKILVYTLHYDTIDHVSAFDLKFSDDIKHKNFTCRKIHGIDRLIKLKKIN